MVEMPIERWVDANKKIAKLEAENENLKKIIHDYEIFEPIVTNKYLQKENEKYKKALEKIERYLAAPLSVWDRTIYKIVAKALEE